MYELVLQSILCPYCGESFETTVDISAGSHQYIEDCQVCCRPIIFKIKTDYAGQLLNLTTHCEDE